MKLSNLKPGVTLYARCPICGEETIDREDLHNHVNTFHAPIRQDFQFQKLVMTVAEQQRTIDALTARLDKLEGKAE